MKKIAIVLILVILSGCAGEIREAAPDNKYLAGFSGIDKEKKIFLVRLLGGEVEFQQGNIIVFDEIASQLEAGGFKVVSMSQENCETLWSELGQEVGGIYSPLTGNLDVEKFGMAMANMIESIKTTGDYGAIIFPAFQLKAAELKGKYAYWDGVKRAHLVKTTGPRDMDWSGHTQGLSLQLTVFGGSGKWLMSTYGGLVLPYYSVIDSRKAENKLKDNIFGNEEDNIKAGVHVALEPILTYGPGQSQPE